MYYKSAQQDELGFDAFIAPDDFKHDDPLQYGGDHPVDIYTKFKEWYPIDSKAKYIYYYSDGNYPLTLTPTADEYYKYGYTQGGVEVMGVDVPLNGAAVTIFNETVTTKRWVIVYRVSSVKAPLALKPSNNIIWVYCGNLIGEPTVTFNGNNGLKYMHYANLNSMTNLSGYSTISCSFTGRATFPETISLIYGAAFRGSNQRISAVNLPNNKNVSASISEEIVTTTFNHTYLQEFNFGASTLLGSTDADRSAYLNIARLSVSPQNTLYTSFDYCDIIYTKDKTVLYWLAPKTVRGLTLPDELPQAQITALGTKLSTNIMQNYQLYIGTLITDLTNLYLSNKSFTTVEVGVGNTAFMAENNILYNSTKTELIKAGTNNTGSLVIDNAVTTIKDNAFLRCAGYTGGLTIPTTVTTIEPSSISALKNLTGSLIFTGGQWNLSTYSYFGFANFTATSIKSIIDNDQLVNGTVGSPKYFVISKTTYDALVALSGGQASIDLAASRFINIRIIPYGYILNYKFDNNLIDSSPMSNNGLGTGAYTFVDGLFGRKAINFTNGKVTQTNNVDLSITDKITIAFWFKSTQTSLGIMLETASIVEPNSNSFFVCNSISSARKISYVSRTLTATDYNWRNTTNDYCDGNWHHFAVVVDRSQSAVSESIIYVDGALAITSIPNLGDLVGNFKNEKINIGCRQLSTLTYNGSMQDLFIYPRVLSSDEIYVLKNIQ